MGLRRIPILLALALLAAGCTGGSADPGPDPSSDAAARSSDTSPADRPAGSTLRYVALGDSFTAAPGIPETDTSDGCQRSTRNYPALVAERLGETRDVTLVDRSCVGADTTDLAGRQQAGTGSLPPQLDAVTRQTDLVTLSIGGNDFGIFLRLVVGCFAVAQQDPTGSPCRDASRERGDPWRDLQPRVEHRLVVAVRAIQRRAPDARVLLVGYPQLPPREGSCPDLLPLAAGDLPFARTVNKALSDELRRAAHRTGTRYVDVWSASAGHDICSEEPWTNGQQAVAGGAVPFHPLPAGEQAVARLVLDAVRTG